MVHSRLNANKFKNYYDAQYENRARTSSVFFIQHLRHYNRNKIYFKHEYCCYVSKFVLGCVRQWIFLDCKC